jgi:hypothetical protein
MMLSGQMMCRSMRSIRKECLLEGGFIGTAIWLRELIQSAMHTDIRHAVAQPIEGSCGEWTDC